MIVYIVYVCVRRGESSLIEGMTWNDTACCSLHNNTHIFQIFCFCTRGGLIGMI